MRITKTELTDMIKETLSDAETKRRNSKIQRQKDREKREKARADSRFRDTDLGRLARGIVEDIYETSIVPEVKTIEDAQYQLAKAYKRIQQLESELAKGEEAYANTEKGRMSWKTCLDNVNAVNKAEKGDRYKEGKAAK